MTAGAGVLIQKVIKLRLSDPELAAVEAIDFDRSAIEGDQLVSGLQPALLRWTGPIGWNYR
jgi:hypothetical protein